MKYFWLISGDTLWRDDWNAIVRARDLEQAVALVTSGSDSVWYSVVVSREIDESFVDFDECVEMRPEGEIIELF